MRLRVLTAAQQIRSCTDSTVLNCILEFYKVHTSGSVIDLLISVFDRFSVINKVMSLYYHEPYCHNINKESGRGGDLRMVKITFYAVCDRGQPQLQDAFYRIKKYCS